MKSTCIFLITLLTVMNVNSLKQSINPFEQVNNLLKGLSASSDSAKTDANAKLNKVNENCAARTAKLEDLIEKQKADVASLESHVSDINEDINNAEAEITAKKNRIESNLKQVAAYKEQRCENNLLFVKTLKEHKQGLEILSLLEHDVHCYFLGKDNGVNPHTLDESCESQEVEKIANPAESTAFIQLQSMVHLFDKKTKEDVQTIRAALDADIAANQNDSASLSVSVDENLKEDGRTAEEIGDDHVDNNKEELELNEYTAETETANSVKEKLLGMIASLKEHLRESKEKLEDDEIQAGNDFADYQYSIEKENEELEEEIKQVELEIIEFKAALKIAEEQLKLRKELLRKTEEELKKHLELCQAKVDYLNKEISRIEEDIITINEATKIYNDSIVTASARVKTRVTDDSNNRDFSLDQEKDYELEKQNRETQVVFF